MKIILISSSFRLVSLLLLIMAITPPLLTKVPVPTHENLWYRFYICFCNCSIISIDCSDDVGVFFILFQKFYSCMLKTRIHPVMDRCSENLSTWVGYRDANSRQWCYPCGQKCHQPLHHSAALSINRIKSVRIITCILVSWHRKKKSVTQTITKKFNKLQK